MEIGGAREDRTPDLLRARQALSQLSYGPKETSHQFSAGSRQFKKLKAANCILMTFFLVGLGGFEPPTSPLSGVRSNQLSYRPNS